MIIGFLKDSTDARVPITPESTKKLIIDDHEVVMEAGAGENAAFPDAAYKQAGVKFASREEVLGKVDILAAVDAPALEDLKKLKSGAWAIALFNPLVNTALVEEIKKLDIKAFSLDRIPRTTIAQSMDVLSSMASIAGYKAVLEAASTLPRYMPMLMTAAGTIPPARVLILGAGVVTIIGLSIPNLVAGALFIESIYSWPGMGSLFVDAIAARDYPMVMGVMLISAIVVLAANLVTDLTYAVADPRIRLE